MGTMSVERRLQICLAATAALGTLLLGLGQSNYTLPIVAVFAAITSVWFTDHRGWFRLNRHAANIFALGAVGFTVLDVTQQDAGRQLVAIANLLIYLQIILLYQRKKLRLYWHLLVLSLLQVVVAAALNLGVEFGVLLVLYMFLSLISMCLLFVLCETADFTLDVNGSSFALAPMPRMQRAPTQRLEDDKPVLAAVLSTDQPTEAMLTRGLVRQVVKLGFTTLLLTFIVFFLTPRFGKSTWRGGPLGKDRLVGFTEEVSLMDIGRLQESPEKVMRVQFVTDGDFQPYEVRSELFLRGSILRDYEPYTGRWKALRPRSHDQKDIPENEPHTTGVVLQTISLEDSEILFSTMPVVSVSGTARNLKMSAEIGQLIRLPPEPKGLAGHFRYEVGSRAFDNGRQRHIVPRRYGTESSGFRLPSIGRYTRFNEVALPSLRGIAQSVIETAEVASHDRIGKIRALEAHLQRLDMFRYTDELTKLPPKGTDPIEHFLTDSREGHCEYFASALTLMLRSQGIPARMVVGFKGGDYNRMGHYYQIRQLHAHAWVEAFLEPDHVPENAILHGETSSDGAWMRVDPSPLDTEPLLTFVGANIFDRLGQVTDYMQMLWNDYILGMDTRRQREAIYKPLMDRTLAAFTDYLFDAEWRRVFFGELISKLGLESLSSFYETWFNWRALPIVVGMVLLLVALYLVLRRPVQRIWTRYWESLRRQVFGRLLRSREIAFYYRLEKLLRRYGLRRSPGQTPYELAKSIEFGVGQAGKRSSERRAPSAVATSPELSRGADSAREIVDLFYRVRFGGRPLNATETKSVEHKLAVVEHACLAALKSRA